MLPNATHARLSVRGESHTGKAVIAVTLVIITGLAVLAVLIAVLSFGVLPGLAIFAAGFIAGLLW